MVKMSSPDALVVSMAPSLSRSFKRYNESVVTCLHSVAPVIDMQIQWFPGHMHKARTEMAESLPKVDLLIEVLDARIPFSSENPMLAALRGKKPCLKILAKSDLADAASTKEWRTYLEREKNVKARAVTTTEPERTKQLTELCVSMFPQKQDIGKQIVAMIAGVPNVGKSTLINVLAGRSVAKTGNEPAITKGQQRVKIRDGIVLLDTPGVLWPNVENKNSGLRLATVGSVKDTAMEYENVALFAARFLLESYPERLADRYELESIRVGPVELLDVIGKKRGCLSKRGHIDYDRASRILLNELRAGMLGPMTFETPAVMERELAELKVLLAETEAAKKQSNETRRARFKAKQKEKRRRL